MEVCFGEPPHERTFQQRLQLPALDLEAGGEGEHLLNEHMVHERHPDFQRVCHRQPVREREDVVGEVGLVVEVQRRCKALPGATLVEVSEALPCPVPSDRVAHRRGVEPLPQRVVGAALEAEVAIGRGARGARGGRGRGGGRRPRGWGGGGRKGGGPRRAGGGGGARRVSLRAPPPGPGRGGGRGGGPPPPPPAWRATAAMLATTADESKPPDRNAATGTSLTRCAATESSIHSTTRRSTSGGAGAASCGRSQ